MHSKKQKKAKCWGRAQSWWKPEWSASDMREAVV